MLLRFIRELGLLACGSVVACSGQPPPQVPPGPLKFDIQTVDATATGPETSGAEAGADADDLAQELNAAEVAEDALPEVVPGDVVLADAELPDTVAEVAPVVDAKDAADAKPDAATKPDTAVKPDTGTKPDVAAVPDAADVDAGDATKDAAADTGPVLPEGGAIGTGCAGQEGVEACSADGKHRAECTNGVWTSLQHCGFGVCKAFAASGGLVLTQCNLPLTSQPKLAAACARYLKCFPSTLTLEDCMRQNLAPAPMVAALTAGVLHPVARLAATALLPAAECAATAKNCGELAGCIHTFPDNKCTSGSGFGCEGALAWTCQGGLPKPLAVSCKALNLKCVVVGGVPACVTTAACNPVAPVTCTANVASQCVSASDGELLSLATPCDFGGTLCKAGATTVPAACAGGNKACDPKTFVADCTAAGAVNCTAAGTQVTTPCTEGQACGFEGQFAILQKTCPSGQSCPRTHCGQGGKCTLPARCTGSEAWFCEGGKPVFFDCKTVGMACTETAPGVRCL